MLSCNRRSLRFAFLATAFTTSFFLSMTQPRAASSAETARELANNLVNKGQEARNSGDIEVALRYFDQAIIADPGYSVAFDNRGEAFVTRNDYDHALLDFNKAIKLNIGGYIFILLQRVCIQG